MLNLLESVKLKPNDFERSDSVKALLTAEMSSQPGRKTSTWPSCDRLRTWAMVKAMRGTGSSRSSVSRE